MNYQKNLINKKKYTKNDKHFNLSLIKFKKEYKLTIPYSIYASYFVLTNLDNLNSKIAAMNFLKQEFEVDKNLGYKLNL